MCTFNRQQGMASTKSYSSASSALPQFLKLFNIIASKGQKFTSHVENSFCKALPPFLDSFDNLPEPLWGWPGKYDCWIVSQSMSSGYEQLFTNRLILKLISNVCFLFPLFFALVHHWRRSIQIGIAGILNLTRQVQLGDFCCCVHVHLYLNHFIT